MKADGDAGQGPQCKAGQAGRKLQAARTRLVLWKAGRASQVVMDCKGNTQADTQASGTRQAGMARKAKAGGQVRVGYGW